MDRDNYTDETYTTPHVPPATPPVIDSHASAFDASHLANDNGDSDYSGTNEAGVDRGGEDDDIAPAETPDEIVPDDGDIVEPVMPDEVGEPGGGDDFAEPGATPLETPLPPD